MGGGSRSWGHRNTPMHLQQSERTACSLSGNTCSSAGCSVTTRFGRLAWVECKGGGRGGRCFLLIKRTTCTSRRQENHRDLQHFLSVGMHMLHLRQRYEIAAGQPQHKDLGARRSPQPPLGGQQHSDHHDSSALGEVWT